MPIPSMQSRRQLGQLEGPRSVCIYDLEKIGAIRRQFQFIHQALDATVLDHHQEELLYRSGPLQDFPKTWLIRNIDWEPVDVPIFVWVSVWVGACECIYIYICISMYVYIYICIYYVYIYIYIEYIYILSYVYVYIWMYIYIYTYLYIYIYTIIYIWMYTCIKIMHKGTNPDRERRGENEKCMYELFFQETLI